jgi:hypothetical protein
MAATTQRKARMLRSATQTLCMRCSMTLTARSAAILKAILGRSLQPSQRSDEKHGFTLNVGRENSALLTGSITGAREKILLL